MLRVVIVEDDVLGGTTVLPVSVLAILEDGYDEEDEEEDEDEEEEEEDEDGGGFRYF